jgi:cytosine/adenosine deaminase-related metal-dependent hydrolase
MRDAWVAVENGTIIGIGRAETMPEALRWSGIGTADPLLRDVAVIPGLVNAHVHLELSWMRGRIPAGNSMPSWASSLMALRRSEEVDSAAAIAAAIDEARVSGTALVGDVANTSATLAPLDRSALSAMVFRELIGFNVDDPEPVIAAAADELGRARSTGRVRATLVPHAPYSVSPGLLAALGNRAPDTPLSIHLAESAAEREFLQNGAGPWRDLLESVAAWNPAWTSPGCAPVEYLDRLGMITSRLVVVHGVHLEAAEIARLADARATIVTCPRSNQWTGAGAPPVEAFYLSGARVAIGTDSLASVDTLSLFDEMAAVRRLAPGIPAGRILRSATLDGAIALGFGAALGSIETGKRAELLAVRVPAGLDDVEEYLVGGVRTEDVRWMC